MGFATKDDFVNKVGTARQTVYGILTAPDDRSVAKTYTSTKDAVAGALGFREWQDLVRAWKADDVMFGLDDASNLDLSELLTAAKAVNRKPSAVLAEAMQLWKELSAKAKG